LASATGSFLKFQTVNGLTIDDVGGDGDHERVRDTRVAEEAVGERERSRSDRAVGSDKKAGGFLY
jgi:hypothetical protein